MSRSESEPDSASLHEWEWPVRRIEMKPAIGGVTTGERSHRTPRGGWGRRVEKDRPRNLGDPRAMLPRESDSP
jgi:hypothetical protein